LLSAERAESKNQQPCGAFNFCCRLNASLYFLFIQKKDNFSFAVLSTAKEIIIISAYFAARAKRAVNL
jgi:hypothetical protein